MDLSRKTAEYVQERQGKELVGRYRVVLGESELKLK
jgi:hypothetical protein